MTDCISVTEVILQFIFFFFNFKFCDKVKKKRRKIQDQSFWLDKVFRDLSG